jgi:hypothetical protein
MIASVARVATKANHQILSTSLKLATRSFAGAVIDFYGLDRVRMADAWSSMEQLQATEEAKTKKLD